jgi:hypothetical protein
MKDYDDLTNDGSDDTILLIRIGDDVGNSLHMAELEDKELADLLRDCLDETERRKSRGVI